MLRQQSFPHETQFLALESSDFLTRGFHYPPSLVDDPGYFDRESSFHVPDDSSTPGPERKIIVVDWEVDKRLLAYPFFGSLIVGMIVAVAVGISTKCIATGAQMGECLCGMVATVFCYVVWRCS